MLERTPFLQFLAPRIARTQTRLGAKIWQVDAKPLAVSQSTPTHEHRPAAEVESLDFRPIASLPLTWGRKFQQCWWRVDLSVPWVGRRQSRAQTAGAGDGDPGEERAGALGHGSGSARPVARHRYLRWKDQAEATVYVRDGKGDTAAWVPHYGIDPGHPYAPIPDSAEELLIESTCCRTGIWVTGEPYGVSDAGSVFEGAFLATRDDDAWHAWHDLDVLLGVCKLLYQQALPRPFDASDPNGGANPLFSGQGYRTPVEVAPPLLRKLIHRLTDAIDAYEQSTTNGPAALRKVTSKIFKEFPAEPWAMRAVLTGHAHIDLVWLWPERVGEFKAVHSFATANTLMETYPELHFGYSQPASYEAVERRSPELMQRVRRRIRKGAWEPTGALYVESDTQIPCGEALVRAVELGQAGFRDLTGKDSSALWLPDVFGFSGVIPTILAGFGVPYFFTSKTHWSGSTRYPHSAFKWTGPDGSEVLSFIAWEHYNLTATPREMKWAADNQRQAAVFNETLAPTGWGDGGGGVSEAMCERTRRMADLATMPRCEWGRIDGFFDRLAKVRDDLPRWSGEMYLEFHRGVQTTHGRLKAAYRAAERGLQVQEAVRCALGAGPMDEHAWKRVCFAQFHDYLPGSSIQEVYDEGVPQLEAITAIALAAVEVELSGRATGGLPASGPPNPSRTLADKPPVALTESVRGEIIFNPLAMDRVEVIDGKVLRVPALTGAPVAELLALKVPPARGNDNILENGRVRVELAEDGRISAMSVDGRDVALAEPMGGLMTFPDLPAVWDAWDVERPTLSLGTLAGGAVEMAFEGDDTRQVVTFTRSLAKQSSATIRYILEAGATVLKVELDLDWRDPHTLLKAVFPTRYMGKNARYGAPFGSALRAQTGNSLADEARFENPASRWACVADETESDGLMVITEAKYGAGCRDGLLHISLLRSAMVTHADENVPLRDFAAYGAAFHTPDSDIGRHVIRYAIGHFRADAPRSEQPAALADILYTPVVRYTGPAIASPGLLGIDGGDSLIPTWAKPGVDNSWTLRLHETLGRRGVAHLRLAEGWTASLVDLRGEPAGSTVGAINGGRLEFGPYALMSVRISRA